MLSWLSAGATKFPSGSGTEAKGLDVLDIELTITLYLYATSKLLVMVKYKVIVSKRRIERIEV
jgi:hypothetical protein